MLVWGDQRTSAFTAEPVPRSNRDNTIFKGGTNELIRALARASVADIRIGTAVRRANREDGFCHIAAEFGRTDRSSSPPGR